MEVLVLTFVVPTVLVSYIPIQVDRKFGALGVSMW